jgi:hypothetical protein
MTSAKRSAKTRRRPRYREERVAIELPHRERGDGETLTFTVRALTGSQMAEARERSTSADGRVDEYGFYARVVLLGCPQVADATSKVGARDAVAWVEERFAFEWGVPLQLADAIIRCSGRRAPRRRPGRTFALPSFLTPTRGPGPTAQAFARHPARVRRGSVRRPGVRRVSRCSSARGSPDDSGDGESDPAGGREPRSRHRPLAKAASPGDAFSPCAHPANEWGRS